MRRILYLAYHFPPIGGAGVQRNSKFVRYLPDFGYDPVVVTGPGPTSDRWTPTDDTLRGDVAPETTVVRLPGPEPAPSGGWRGRAERWLALRTPWTRWCTDNAVRVGAGAGRSVDLIYASLVPYETAEAAMRLSQALGKPWVADLQDPWALDEMWVYPSGLHRALDTGRMRAALRSADAIVMNTPEAAVRVQRCFPELARKLVVSIPNGYDAADFGGAAPRRDDGTFRIVHTGYLHTDLGLRHRRTAFLKRILGGAVRGVDILTRSHVFLLEAIERLIEEDPSLASAVEVHLAGVLSEGDRNIGGQHAVVRMLGYLPHPETVALMRSADLLFLPMHDLPLGTPASIVPGKTYEYLASETPILAAVPDGDARSLLDEAGSALLCRPADTKAMKDLIQTQVERWRDQEPTPRPDGSVLARFERRHLTDRLASVFDELCAARVPARDQAGPEVAA